MVFNSSPQDIYFMKSISLKDYDQDSNLSLLIQDITKLQINICELIFFQNNSSQSDLFDLVFQYGKKVLPKQDKPERVWALIEQIIEGMI